MKMQTKKKLIALAVVATLPLAAQAQNGITDLGVLSGGSQSIVLGISADGAVVVGAADNGVTVPGFRWTQAGGMTSLGALNGGNGVFAVEASTDGTVIVGRATDGAAGNSNRAFRWTQAGGIVSLGLLNGGSSSLANGVSGDGSVVVGKAYDGATGNRQTAFRWTQVGGLVSLGMLNGGTGSGANGISGDGTAIVGWGNDGVVGNATRAFRWTQAGGMASLGALNGGTLSQATDTNVDGSVVVGTATDGAAGNATRAFRWTQAGGMASLGSLNGGTSSGITGDTVKLSVSSNGNVVVGQANDGAAGNILRGFRWTQSAGMQTVEDWLRASGVTVASNVTKSANDTNSDGSVVVGELQNGRAYLARAASGLVTLADVQTSLGATATAGNMALSAAGTVLNGAHSRPLVHRVAAGKNVFWLAGDWGRDDHGARSGDLGIAEVGGGLHLGPVQLNVSLGQTWAKQSLSLNGRAESDGSYLMAEALMPLGANGNGGLWATLGGYGHLGKADLRRGYLNVGLQDNSTGNPDVDTWGVRARLDWENAYRVVGNDFTPYADFSYSEAKMAAYTETGGGFPAQFNARKDKATELRLGVNTSQPIAGNARLLGTLEAAHRFENTGARTVGQVIGLFGFDLAGPAVKQDWLRAAVGVEGKLADGTAALSLNVTTKGEAPSTWLAASWQMAF